MLEAIECSYQVMCILYNNYEFNLIVLTNCLLLLFKVALGLVNDIDLRILAFSDYGKGFMKTAKVSPDAFIQMALQLAYYRVINYRILM